MSDCAKKLCYICKKYRETYTLTVMAVSSITTGQFVTLRLTHASVSERIIAQIIDYMVMFAYSIFAFFLLILLGDRLLANHSVLMLTVTCILGLPLLFYHLLFEVLNNGQSIGKKAMKIKVSMLDGSTPTLGAYLLRWVLLIVDGPPLLLGLIFIIFTKHSQRIGDLAAGTCVIKLNSDKDTFITLNDFSYVQPGYRPTYPEAADLSVGQADVISRAIYSDGNTHDYYVDRLAKRVQDYLHIAPPMGMSNEQYLRTIINDYYYYSSTLEE